MIKKVTDINSVSGVLSPLLPLIYGDFEYPYNDSDGVFIQTNETGEETLLFSLKNASAVIVKKNGLIDLNELITFFDFLNVTSYISDFSLGVFAEKKYTLLNCVPKKTQGNGACVLSNNSNFSHYEQTYKLLSENGNNFENWFITFSKKINNQKSVAVYKSINGVPVSTAAATAIYNNTAVISGVFTSVEHRKKGYAAECVESLLNELYKIDVQNTYLWCENKNISFYKKIGFTVCGEICCGEDF